MSDRPVSDPPLRGAIKRALERLDRERADTRPDRADDLAAAETIGGRILLCPFDDLTIGRDVGRDDDAIGGALAGDSSEWIVADERAVYDAREVA